MQHIGKSDLSAVKAELHRANLALSRARGIFIKAGYAAGAAATNGLISKIASLLARIERALAAKP
jgi:hypothetical protein